MSEVLRVYESTVTHFICQVPDVELVNLHVRFLTPRQASNIFVQHRSTQRCIALSLLNRVPDSAVGIGRILTSAEWQVTL